MLMLKPGVRIAGLRPEILFAIVAAERAYAELGADCVLTACVDGKHSPGSLHYVGQAVDFRTSTITAEKRQSLTARLRSALGEDFDVILETDHLHIEYQPKRPLTA